jgi:hypothetical protein
MTIMAAPKGCHYVFATRFYHIVSFTFSGIINLYNPIN